MKMHRLVVYIVDHDELGARGCADTISRQKYPNWCIYPSVGQTDTVELGEWSDEHPINTGARTEASYFDGEPRICDPYDIDIGDLCRRLAGEDE